MGTRGLIGFYKDKVTKASYNHYDSYPSYLGNKIKEYIGEADLKKMNREFDGIQFVTDDMEVTPEIVIQLYNFWYGDVDKLYYHGRNKGTYEMYDILSRSHTDLQWCADCKMMIDGQDFIKDSLFCEWAYLINLDRGVLEIYRGFQHKPPKKNRYAMSKDEIAKIKADLKKKGKGHSYTTTDNITGKTKKVFYKNHAYYNCDIIAQIPLESVQFFDMDLFEEMVGRAEDMNDDVSCGNILDPKYDLSEVARSTTLPMTLKVLGLVTLGDNEEEDN